jgi:MFS transporter, NNP family, nitrate/nitrite transporter
MPAQPQTRPAAALTLATAALALAFASWGLLAPFTAEMEAAGTLTAGQARLVLVAPVMLGALGRLILSRTADRWKASRLFAALLTVEAVALLLLGLTRTSVGWLGAALLLGASSALFTAGIPLIAHWFPHERRGLALGIFGVGNLGAFLSAWAAPWAAHTWGWPWVFWAGIPVVLVLAWLCHTSMQEAPPPLAPPGQEPHPAVWLLGFWYFVTFGGFLAFGGYLPTLYADMFGLAPAAAAQSAILFLLAAPLFRPAGGWLADRYGAKPVLTNALFGIAVLAATLTLAPPLGPFRLTMFLLAVGFGLGNGALTALLPRHFPAQLGAAAGIVGAVGLMGGFFPPLLMTALNDRLHTYTPAFALLAVAAGIGWLLVGSLREREVPWQRPREDEATRRLEQLFASRAAMNCFLVVVILLVLVYVGTDALHHFDPALYGYAVATTVATIGMTIRITVWLMRPATRTLALNAMRRLFLRVNRRPGVTNPVPAGVGRWFGERRHPGGYIEARDRLPQGRGGTHLPAVRGGDPGLKPEGDSHAVPGRPGPAVAARNLGNHILLNRFIFRRSVWRGLQHFLTMWGVIGSYAITIPLTFGWLHFEVVNETSYAVVVMGLPLFTMPVHGVLAGLIYHGLSTFALITLIGIGMMLVRRLLDRDARVDNRVEYDLVPLYLLLAVTVTGLALTVSHMFAEGWGYPWISGIHQVTVVLMLLYLPFGKLFHIPMRSLAVGADVYHEVGAHEGLMACARCQKVYATRRQIMDVIAVLKESGMSLLAPDGKTYLAEYCPECRRVIRGIVYSRRPLRPEEAGSPNPVMETDHSQGGPTVHA